MDGSRAKTGRSRGRRRLRIVGLVLAFLVVGVALGLGFGCSPSRQSTTTTSSPATTLVTVGAGAAASAQSGAEGYSQEETDALSRPLPANAVSVHVPVLMYHYVDAEPPPAGPYADGLTVRTPDFVEEMQYLADHGYHTVTLADAYLAMAGLGTLPAKPVALTFDDGGLDNYTVAFPILKQHHQRATFFVITKTVGGKGQMTWAQLAEMADAGMSIQSHTVSHPDLPSVSASRLRSELADSRDAIREALDRPVYAVAYPAGSFNQKVIAAAKAAGYVMGISTSKGSPLGPKSVFEITRRRVQAYLPLVNFARLVE